MLKVDYETVVNALTKALSATPLLKLDKSFNISQYPRLINQLRERGAAKKWVEVTSVKDRGDKVMACIEADYDDGPEGKVYAAFTITKEAIEVMNHAKTGRQEASNCQG